MELARSVDGCYEPYEVLALAIIVRAAYDARRCAEAAEWLLTTGESWLLILGIALDPARLLAGTGEGRGDGQS